MCLLSKLSLVTILKHHREEQEVIRTPEPSLEFDEDEEVEPFVFPALKKKKGFEEKHALYFSCSLPYFNQAILCQHDC